MGILSDGLMASNSPSTSEVPTIWRYLQFGLIEVGERVKPKVRSRLKTSCKSIGLQN